MKPMSWPLLGAVLLLQAGLAQAQSLWEHRDPNSAFLYVDTRARHVGDLLTIVVQENTGIDQLDQRDMNKQTLTSGLFNLIGTMTGNVATRTAGATLNGSNTTQRQFDGKSEYISNRNFIDNMTVTVMQVLPNGNLVVQGSRRRIVSGEERTLHVSGVVRPLDIAVGNLVQSQSVANFEITYAGKGAEYRMTNQGWASRVMNYVWPF